MAAGDQTELLCAAVRRCHDSQLPLEIVGSGSKAGLVHHAGTGGARLLSLAEHAGVLEYKPEELVLTARAGTPLRAIERLLAESGQYLPFEPPRLLGGGTLGGALASGLSGPGRPWRGALRDAVLGVELVNGRGECLRFGGQVMKNVAGYDVARLQVGAFGTLGLLLAASVKVMPRPESQQTVCLELAAQAALERCRTWAREPMPISATCFFDGVLRVRLSGAEAAVQRAARDLGGANDADGGFWDALRDQRLGFFSEPGLWRAAVPPATPLAGDAAAQLITWGGAERWWRPTDPAAARAWAATAGGHARPYDGSFGCRAAAGLDPLEAELGCRLRAAFDPAGVFNPGLSTRQTIDAN